MYVQVVCAYACVLLTCMHVHVQCICRCLFCVAFLMLVKFIHVTMNAYGWLYKDIESIVLPNYGLAGHIV